MERSVQSEPQGCKDFNSHLSEFIHENCDRRSLFLGYQTSQHIDFPAELLPLLSTNLLNIGDAFTEGKFKINAKEAEKYVLDYYARLWNAPEPDKANSVNSYWGYVTTMGSTEGNLCGLWNARDFLLGRKRIYQGNDKPLESDANNETNISVKPPVLLCSRETHYSVTKAAQILNICFPSEIADANMASQVGAPTYIPSMGDGRIDVKNLVYWARKLYELGHPLIFSLNYGSTFKCAFDPIEEIVNALPEIFSGEQKRYWIHVDAALCGNTMPWLEKVHCQKNKSLFNRETSFPHFDFRIEQVSSICASPYKWIGAPWPYGVYLCRAKNQVEPPSHPKYIGSPDTTLSGSRNGLACIFTWHHLETTSSKQYIDDVSAIEELAEYAYQKLKEEEDRLLSRGIELSIYPRNPFSPIIFFKKPNDKIIEKYSLCYESGLKHDIAHIVILKHSSKDVIDQFISDLVKGAGQDA